MAKDASSNFDDISKYFLKKEDLENITKKFAEEFKPFLEKNKDSMLVLKGMPEIHGYSTTYGQYTGKQMALYISKNEKKLEKLKNIDLDKFYLEIEKTLI
jgi:hypothetical protein